MIRIDVTGNLGQDAEVREIKGHKYHSFSIAHNEKRAGRDITTWVRCLKRVSENDKLGQYLKKGTQVLVSGMPYASAYMRANEPTADLNVFVNTLELLGSKPTANAPQPTADGGDDLPF